MSLTPGQRLGHYEIDSLLGSGGMGEVYRARDPRLGRDVAIKVLPSNLANNEELLGRFEREAKALASLSHPNILSIFDFGKEGDTVYAVTELLDGENLRSYCKRLPVSWEKALEIGTAVADGLSAAHSKGVIHRDLKPENIFITSDGRVKLLDFGLARFDQDAWNKSGHSQLPTVAAETKKGIILGTVGYMSPEQVLGGSLDARTDIFSFGCVLYEMVTGISPFTRDSAPETMAAILKEEPPDLTRSGKFVPPQLDHVVMRCLKKNVEERFHSAHDLSFALKEILKSSATISYTPFTGFRLRRRAWLPVTLALLVALLAAVYFFVLPETQQPATRLPVAVADFVNETNERELDGLSGMLITSLEQSRRLSVLTRSRMFDILKQMGRENVDRIDEDLGKEISRQANVQALIIASIRKFDRLYTIDLKVLDPQKNEYVFTAKEEGMGKESIPSMIDELSEKTRVGLKEKQEEISRNSQKVASVTTANLRAYQHFFQGEQLINKLQFKDAEKEFNQAIALDPAFALAYYRLAYARWWFHNETAKEPMEKALQHIDKVPEKERRLMEAQYQAIEGNHEKAIELSKALLQTYPTEKEALYMVGDLSYHRADFQSALVYFEKLLEIDQGFERALEHIVWTYRDTGNYTKMLEYAKKYVARQPNEESYFLLVSAYNLNGNFAASIETLENARQLFPDNLGASRGIAGVYVLQEDFKRAEAELNQLLKRSHDKELVDTYSALMNLAVYKGQYDQAREYCDRIGKVELKEPDRNLLSESHALKAFWYSIENDRANAEKELQSALSTRKKDDLEGEGLLYAVYMNLGQFDKASKFAQKNRLYPFGDEAVRAYAALYKEDYNEAIRILEPIVMKGYLSDRAHYGYDLAYAYYKTGQYDNAIRMLHTLQDIHLNDFFRGIYYARTYYLLAKAYEAKGQQDTATRNYARFLRLWKDADPHFPELKDAKTKVS